MPELFPLDIARFWSKVAVSYPNDCWEWLGGRFETGYGQFNAGGKALRAHRVAYEIVHGPVPEGLVLDHLCRNPLCCNPAHLEAVTNRENTLRGIGPTAANAQKTHCPRGHAYTPPNTIQHGGKRECRICNREKKRRARAAKKLTSAICPPGSP
jgi:hypothetical protein